MANRNTVHRVEFANATKAKTDREPTGRETYIGPHVPGFRPLDEQRTTVPAWIASKMPSGATRDLVRMATHGLGQTGTTLLRFLDIPNRVFGNTRSRLQDIYESAERNMARDEFEDKSGVPQIGETAVHLASAGILGKALPAVFGANVGADTYETAKYAGASEGEALAKGVGHGAVDTAIWTLGQGLASKYLPKAWQWLGRELTGAMRGATSSVTSDAVLNSLGADISGEEMAKRAVHAAWMVPLLGMLKMGGKRREEAMSLLRKARPDLAGERADKVIETIEAEFADPKSQKVALAWVARKGANLPDDTAQIRQALEVSSKVKGLDPMSRSPFEILSNPAYTRYLPKPRPQDVKAFSNMKRYPMGVIGFDVSDDAAGRQATREMINAYMSPSSNPWCLATGKDAAKLGGLGPGAEGYWKQHSAVPKQIFFQEVDGKLELTAFRATGPGGEGQQEYWDTSDAGYSGIPLKVKVPGDPMGRYRKMVFRPDDRNTVTYRESESGRMRALSLRDARLVAQGNSPYRDYMSPADIDSVMSELQRRDSAPKDEVQGTFEDIAPGKVFKGDSFRDGRSQTWVRGPDRMSGDPTIEIAPDVVRSELERRHLTMDLDGLRALRKQMETGGTSGELDVVDDTISTVSDRITGEKNRDPFVLVEDKVRTTENGITKFRTTKYADPTNRDYEPPKPGEQPKPVEIEESELVSPEWMRSRGYDPESEVDVRRMQQELDIRAWGNGAEAAMAVVPTKRTYMQTKSGTPETVTYGPNGRDIVSVDFEENGVPYREEFFQSGPDYADPSYVYRTIGSDEFPYSSTGLGINEPSGSRLTRNPDGATPEVLNEVQWNEGLGSFVRTSGNRRWRMPSGGAERLAREQDLYEAWLNDPASMAEGRPPEPAPAKIIIEDRQPDGTWAPVETRSIQTSPSRVNTLPPPSDEIPLWVQQGLTEEALREEAEYNEAMERTLVEERGRRFNMGDDVDGDVPFALKAGRTRRNVRAAEGGGKTPKWTWGTYRWNPEAKGGRLVDPKNIKGTGVAFDERDRAVLPDEKRAAFEAWMDELANPKGEWVTDDGRKVRVSSRLVPKDWRTNKTYNRDYDYVRAFLLTENNPELRNRLVGPLYHEEDGKYWLHMNDLGKLPTHPTFSRGSYYARNPRYADLAGDWEGETYIPGKAERGVRQDALGGNAEGPKTAVSETPVSEAPQNPGGPRIVINPQVFSDKRDALCVAFNEAFRVVMEANGFEPVSEPTERQRKFFADTAYADDEVQLRRTILARIATLDTSVKDPTDEQLEETAEMLEMVMETGAPQNEWEQSAVQRLHDVVVQARESTRANGSNEAQPEPPEDEASAQAAVGGGMTEDDDDDDNGEVVLPEQPAAPQPEQPDARPAAPMQKPDQGRVHARWALNSSFTDKDGRRVSDLHHFDRDEQGRVHAGWMLNSSFVDQDGRRVSNLHHFDRDEQGRVHAGWMLDSSFVDQGGRRVSNLHHFDRDEQGRVHAKWALDEQNA